MSASTVSATVPRDSVHFAQRRRGLIFIGISVIVLSLDNTILNTALPAIALDLGASIADLQWIVDGYVLVFAALLLTMGTLGDRIGRKRALQVGLVLFAVGSLGAALSPNTLALIIARMFLGIAAALMLPATLSIVTATFPAEERPQAIATWASIFGLGVAIGPVLGGLLVQAFSWHAIFLVNLPVIAVALAGGYLYLGETREPNAPPPDVVGALLSIAGLFALVYGLVEAGVAGWTNPAVVTALLLAVVLLGVFALWEARTRYPMLPMQLFRNRAFTGANVTLTLLTFGLFGVVFFMPQYLQLILGYPPFVAGLLILPLAATLTFVTSRSARVARRLGTKRTVAVGLAIAGSAFLYMALVFGMETTYFPWILIGQMAQAAGIGLAISPATTAIMSSVPVEKAGVGSAMNDTTRQVGGALGVAIFGTIATSIYLRGIAPLQGRLPAEAYDRVAAGLPAALNPITQTLVGDGLWPQVLETTRTAFMDGLRQSFFTGAFVMYGAALFAFLVLPNVVAGRGRQSAVAVEPPPAVDGPGTTN